MISLKAIEVVGCFGISLKSSLYPLELNVYICRVVFIACTVVEAVSCRLTKKTLGVGETNYPWSSFRRGTIRVQESGNVSA